ncbi:MAG: hypothetical protein AAGE80_01100 [Pseudomonadota bacterium]
MTTRWILALPGALIASVLTMATMPLWMPQGGAQIDHIVMPVVLFPLIWVVFFMYCCMEENLPRGSLVMIGTIAFQSFLIVTAF